MYGPSPLIHHPGVHRAEAEALPRRSAGVAPAPALVPALVQSVGLWDRPRDRSLPVSPRLRQAWSAPDTPPADCAIEPPAPSWDTATLTSPSTGQATARLSIPVQGPHVRTESVLTLALRCEPGLPAGIEIWRQDSCLPGMLAMRSGWYSDAAAPMAQQTPHTRLPYGTGLPGLAWELGSPAYFSHIGTSQMFVRADAAQQSGLHHGLAIPVGCSVSDPTVLALLTGTAQPIARRVELAVADGHDLRCVAGHCVQQGDLLAHHLAPPWAAPLVRDCARQRGPVLVHRDEVAPHADWFEALDAQRCCAGPSPPARHPCTSRSGCERGAGRAPA